MEFSLHIIYVSNYGYNAGEKNSHKNLFMSPSICKRLLWSESSHSSQLSSACSWCAEGSAGPEFASCRCCSGMSVQNCAYTHSATAAMVLYFIFIFILNLLHGSVIRTGQAGVPCYGNSIFSIFPVQTIVL